MTTNTTHQLRLNGYGADSDGRLICYRTPEYRYGHEQLGVIQINAPKDFAAKIVASLDYEPACLVGIGRDHMVVLFRTATRNVRANHPFIIAGKQGSLFATVEGAPVDVSDFQWRNDRSPVSVPYSALPPLFEDHVEAALAAVTGFGGTLCSLPTAAEIAAQRAREERYAKYREEIAQGLHTPEKIAEREDDALVADHEGVEYAEYDGNMAALVLAARRRVARRKADAEAARFAALTPEERAEEIQAREDAAIVARHEDSKITEGDGEYAVRIIRARARHAARLAAA
jgi:hypothetical protein